jgi:3-oxoacyl-[acyl-carrier-protein] synthase-3
MAFLKINNVRVKGISACVPRQIDENSSSPLFDKESFRKFVESTGIERKRKAPDNVCTSDLCIQAAEKLISDLNWNKDDISALVFVTQTPDYILPATSPLIQQRLGLGKDCYTLDISLGCSGWVYGMSVIAGLLQNAISDCKSIKWGGVKALLLVGDTILKINSETDKSTRPLFGDAGTATALEYQTDTEPLLFNMNSDGAGHQTIIGDS